MKILSVLLFLLFLNLSALAQADYAININKVSSEEYIANYFEYFLDKENTKTIETLQESDFNKSTSSILNIGFTTGSVWVKFKVSNNSDKYITKILQIQKPLQDSLILFTKENHKWKKYYSGVKIDNKLKKIKGGAIYFPLDVKPHELKTYYIRAKSKYGISFASHLFDYQDYINYRLKEMLIVAIIIGALFAIAIYNFVIGYGFKDNTYYYYAALIIVSVLIQATVRGFFLNYLSIDNNFFKEWWPPFIIALGVILFCVFSIKFLEPIKYNKFANLILKGLIYFTVISFVIEFVTFEIFGFFVTNKLIAIATMIVGLAALSSGIIVYRKGNKFARYFIIAWFFYSFSIIIYVGTLVAFLPINWFTTNAYMLGSFLEVSFLSFALIERYRKIEAEKEEFKDSLLRKNEEVISKESEIAKLILESIVQIETKSKLTEDLKILVSNKNDSSLKTIIANLNSDKLDDNKKLIYKQNLDKVNGLLISKLKAVYPNLTDTDLEMALFAKMNLSMKEMANLRNTSVEAIKKNRYRLRKKLNIVDDISLEDFLSNFL